MASRVGSIGMDVLSLEDPVRMSVLKRGLRRVSKRFLMAVDDAAWLIMEFETSWPSLAFIWSITFGGPLRSSKWTAASGVDLEWRYCVWITLTRFLMVEEIWGDMGTGSMSLLCTPQR